MNAMAAAHTCGRPSGTKGQEYMKNIVRRLRFLCAYLWKRLPGRILLLILLLVLPLNVLNIVMVRGMDGMVMERSSASAQSQMQDVLDRLKRRMDNAVRLQFYFASSDEDCIHMLNRNGDDYTQQVSRMKFYARLKTMAQITDGADAYYYLIPDGDIFLSPMLSDAGTTGRSLMAHELAEGWNGWRLIAREENTLLVYAQTGRQSSPAYGCWIALDDELNHLMADMNYEQIALRLRDRAGNEIILGDRQDAWDAGRDRVYLSAGNTMLTLEAAIAQGDILGRLDTYQRIAGAAAVISLFFLPMLYLALRRLAVIPIAELNRANQQIKNGQEDYRIAAWGTTDEFREAFGSFNAMADSLRDYRIAAYEKALEAQDMELMNLQLQIRPHFLLNTFNLMYNLTKLNEGAAVQEIIMYLSDYFRYMFREGQQLDLLPRELELIRGYIRLADMRYFGRVHAEYELDPELDYLRVPPLLLHNFVENAVKYGVRESGELHILIRGEYRERDGEDVFQISNDGSGMPPEILERNRRILSGELVPENRNAHVGLFNSYRRLKYFYGEEASVTLDCEPGLLTVFTIRFPYHLDAEALEGEEAAYMERGGADAPDEME